MRRLRAWIVRLGGFFHRARADRELAEELESHLQMHAEDNRRAGMAPAEARRQARIKLGGLERVREDCRERRGWPALETVLRDLRYGLRMLRKSPGFAIVAALTLMLGIGASTAIFSVVDAVLLRALPYPNPQNLVRVWEQAPDGRRMNLAAPNFEDFRAQNDTFAYLSVYEHWLSSVSGGSEPVRVDIAEVSQGFFPTLGVAPVRGRAFVPEEQRLYGTPAAIVGYGYWQRYLGGAADLSRFHLQIEGTVYSVVGVMPAGFDFPADTAVWIPRELLPELPSRRAHNWRGLGLLRNGATLAQARTNLGAVARRLHDRYGSEVDLDNAAVVPLAAAMVGDVQAALLTLLGAVGLLLLIACANVAGLLLARTSARRQELAVRVALGAGRGRLVQQFLAESFSLALAGGALGVLLAMMAVRALPAILPADLPRRQGIAINPPVLLFALAATVAVAIALGLFAAWRAPAGDLHPALAAGSPSHTGAGASQRFRNALVVGEIAATLVILVGAGLLGRSFLRLISTSPGFSRQNLVVMQFSLPLPPWQAWQAGTPPPSAVRPVHLVDAILARLRATPGVEAVGFAGALPVAGGDNLASGEFVILNGQKPPISLDELGRMAQNPLQAGHADYGLVGEAYFRTLGIPLLRGRTFGEQDDGDSPHVAVISASLARQRWPQRDPIGQVIDFGSMDGNLKPLTIVGVVGDVRSRGLDATPGSIIYVDYRQRGLNPNTSPTILLRGAVPAGEVVAAARGIFHDLAPDAPVQFSTFAEAMGGWLANRRFLLLLVGVFAAAALALAAVGIYGVVAFSVARRTQEIGIRMALGARRGDVLRLVVGEGARLAALGVALGLAVSFAAVRLLSNLLFGVSATDPVTFVAVAALLALVALLASYLPARRALRIAPMIALRRE